MTDAEFIKKASTLYGSNGKREARQFLQENKAAFADLDEESASLGMDGLKQAWLINKEHARQKFTPKKYRKETL